MSPTSLSFCLAFLIVLTTSEIGPPKTYQTSLGADVKCLTKSTKDSKEINAINCYGLPYAKPPINELRFKYPVKINAFTDANPKFAGAVWDATKKPNGCMQYLKGQKQFRHPDFDFDSPEFAGVGQSEDCLYLNIYRPNNDAIVPVMVWFHGGNFRWGYAASDIC